MTQSINPHVLKQVLCEFPNRFSSSEVAKYLSKKGYNYNTKSGLLAYHFREFGFKNEKKRSKMWIKNPTLLQEFREDNYLLRCSDDELIKEIKRRGYTGTLNPPSKSIIL